MISVISKKTICVLLDAEAVYITQTGWNDFHVIRELGDLGESYYERLTGEDVFKKYKLNANLLLTTNNDTRALN